MLSHSLTLKELLQNDYIDQANIQEKNVISEEAIQFLIHLYNKDGKLKNASLVSFTELADQVESHIKNYKPEHGPLHFQYIVESGERGEENQRDKGTIHYCAADLILLPNFSHTIFIADHYKGHNVEIFPLKRVEANTGLLRVQAGGGRAYQADETHCFIFTLDHLLMTANDFEYLKTLKGKDGKVQWKDLAPQYLLNYQSFSALTEYVDVTSKNALTDAKFDIAISENILALKKSENKVINVRVLNSAKTHGAFAYRTLENEEYSEAELIDICYKRHEALKSILKQSDVQIDKDSLAHPLFEAVFYNIYHSPMKMRYLLQ